MRACACGFTLGLFTALAGCTAGGGPLARWRLSQDKAIAPPGADEVGDTRGPIARFLTPEAAPAHVDRNVQKASLEPVRRVDPEVQREFDQAEELYRAGNLAEAERAFTRLERKRAQGSISDFLGIGKKKDDNTITGILRKSQPGWGEKALYFLAQTQYKRGKLVDAHDSIDKLLVNYPGTQYLDEMVKMEYEIAQTWLDAVDSKAPPERREQWNDRVTRRMPLADVSGNALLLLEHVRQRDVKGPLADQAVMRIADYHYIQSNYEEASEYYDQLIASYPKSPLAHKAYLQSIDAKLKAYGGPQYDTMYLTKAKEQIHQVRNLYPEHRAETADELAHKLDLIEDQEAEMAFRRGEFYKQTGYPEAAELAFGEVRARWPESEWSKNAEGKLEEIARMPRRKVEPSKIMTKPGSVDPYTSGMTGGNPGASGSPMGGMGGAGIQ